MANKVEHLFTGSSAICTSSLWSAHLSLICTHSLSSSCLLLRAFHVLVYPGYLLFIHLHIQDTSPMSNRWCASIFPQRVLNFDTAQFISVFHYGLCFWCHASRPVIFSPLFFSRRLIFILHFHLFGLKLCIKCEVNYRCFLHLACECLILLLPFIEKTLLPQLPLHLCQKSDDRICVGLFLACMPLYWSICLPVCQYHTGLITEALE